MRLSIITINYNNVEGLAKTLNSIYHQGAKDYEMVVIDGGSNDGSKELISNTIGKFSNHFWDSEKDNGIYNAMNKGVKMSHGDYCLFMNSGDCFYSNNTLKESMIFLDGKTDIISGSVKTDTFSKEAPEEKDLSLSFFLKDSMNHQSTFIKRDLLLKYPYNEDRKIVGDSEFFFQTLVLHNATYKRIPLFISYCETAGESGDLEKSLDERFTAIKNLLPPRMETDVDFIVKYHNPIVMHIGNLLYTKRLRWMFFKFNRFKDRLLR